MHKSKGVGLAAEQVGRLEKVCVIDIPKGYDEVDDELFNAPIPMPLVMFNPVVVAREGSCREKEGCLSFPGVYGEVTRPEHVVVRAQDRYGEFFEVEGFGLTARAFCHEIDHLDGVVFTSLCERMLTQEELENGKIEE